MTGVARTRYNRRFAVAMITYVIVILAVTWIFKHGPIPSPLSYGLAALPALPVIAFIACFGLYLAEEKDDFLRSTMMRASLWATGVVLSATTFWGFIENYVQVAQVPMYWIFVAWSLVLGVAQVFIRRQYR